MARFTVTFHLQGGGDADYASLAEAMLAAKFTRTFRDAGGKMYEMPPGSFNMAGAMNAADVRNRAAKVGEALGRPFAVIVSEAAKRHCVNLTEVEGQAPAGRQESADGMPATAPREPVGETANPPPRGEAPAAERPPVTPFAINRRRSSMPTVNGRSAPLEPKQKIA